MKWIYGGMCAQQARTGRTRGRDGPIVSSVTARLPRDVRRRPDYAAARFGSRIRPRLRRVRPWRRLATRGAGSAADPRSEVVAAAVGLRCSHRDAVPGRRGARSGHDVAAWRLRVRCTGSVVDGPDCRTSGALRARRANRGCQPRNVEALRKPHARNAGAYCCPD